MALYFLIGIYIFSLIGMLIIIVRRISDIATITVESMAPKHVHSLRERLGQTAQFFIILIITIFSYLEKVILWLIHFSLEKALHRIRILALKIENFSARHLEELHLRSQRFPHLDFFQDLSSRDKKEKKRE